jgi:hypothetical protein
VLIPILLVIIICILLFGAVAIKNAIARSFTGFISLIPLALLWQAAKSAPPAFWWFVGGVVLVAAVAFTWYAVRDHRRVQGELKAARDAEVQRLRDYGMTDEEIAEHDRLLAANDFAGATKVFSDSMGRVASEQLRTAGHPGDDQRYSEWARSRS